MESHNPCTDSSRYHKNDGADTLQGRLKLAGKLLYRLVCEARQLESEACDLRNENSQLRERVLALERMVYLASVPTVNPPSVSAQPQPSMFYPATETKYPTIKPKPVGPNQPSSDSVWNLLLNSNSTGDSNATVSPAYWQNDAIAEPCGMFNDAIPTGLTNLQYQHTLQLGVQGKKALRQKDFGKPRR